MAAGKAVKTVNYIVFSREEEKGQWREKVGMGSKWSQ